MVASAPSFFKSSPSAAAAVCSRVSWERALTFSFLGFSKPSCDLHPPLSSVSHVTPVPADTIFVLAPSWLRFVLAPAVAILFSAITLDLQSRTGTKDLQHVDLKLRVLFRPQEHQLPAIHVTYGLKPQSLILSDQTVTRLSSTLLVPRSPLRTKHPSLHRARDA